VAAGTVVVRTALQKRAGYFRSELPYTDDLEMLLRLALLGDVAETPDIQGLRRLHGANMSEAFLRDRVSDLAHREAAYRSFLGKEGAELPGMCRLRRRLDGGLAEQAYLWGLRELSRGNIREAVSLFGYAIRVRPAIALVPPVHAPFRSDRAVGRFAAELVQRLRGATCTRRLENRTEKRVPLFGSVRRSSPLAGASVEVENPVHFSVRRAS
jgi:hypothetical protein